MYMYGIPSPSYLVVIIITMIIGGFATSYVNRQLKKYSQYPISNGLTGRTAAMQMLSYYGITDVNVVQGGTGQDFFDPRTNSITLSPDAYNVRSITATATACHEAGHACQYAQGYIPIKIRGALVPVVNFASNAWFFILILGIFLKMTSLFYIAVIVYGLVLLFQLATLPVEFNASSRAIKYMESIGMSEADKKGSKKVLRACAFTYVAAALSAALQLL